MNVCHVLAVLFALIAGTPALTLLSPVRVAQRVVPALMIAVALGLWFLPTGIVTAIALVPVAAWISARLGIQHAENEPVNVAPAVELAKNAAQAARTAVQKRLSKPDPEVRQFVARAYPSPDDAENGGLEPADDELLDDADQGEYEPETSTADAARERLAGLTKDSTAYPGLQRPGLREQHAPVRKFVPSLLG
jgi:hypothetical protein